MDKKDAIKNAVTVAAAHGFTLPDSLGKMVADIENPQYRVAVVGKYQVGKSALINRVFLDGKALLTEGRGLCTTAVATDMEYGPSPKLEVYNWQDVARTSDTCVKTIDNPTLEDVNAATVSSDMSTRAQLAHQISRVRVCVPNNALRGYTVVDTPGLDDPEPNLLADTTFRIIPGADVALMIVGARNLDETEKRFLRTELIGKNGISRILLLVSYNAKTGDGDEAQRELIVKTIKAELASIGRGDIEVKMYCFDSSIEDKNVLSEISEIRMTIRQFLNANALPGREEKLVALLKMELEAIQVQIAAQLKVAGASEEEVETICTRVEDEVVRFKEKCESEFESLKFELGGIRDQMYNDVDLAVDGVFARFCSQIEAASDLSAIRAIIEKADAVLKADLQAQVSVIGLKLKEKIASAVNAYSNKISGINADWNLFLSDEFGVKRPLITKIPPLVFDAINVVLLNIVLPGGWIVAIIAQLLGRSVFDPTKWGVQKIAVSQIRKAMDESKGDVRQQIMDQIADGLAKSFAGIKEAIEKANRAQVEAIRNGITTAAAPGASVNRVALESAKADVENALVEL